MIKYVVKEKRNMGNKNGVPVLRDEDIQHLKQSTGMDENQVANLL